MAESDQNRSIGKHMRAPGAQPTRISASAHAAASTRAPRFSRDLPGFDDETAAAAPAASSTVRTPQVAPQAKREDDGIHAAAAVSMPKPALEKPKKKRHIISNLLLLIGIGLLIAAGVLWWQAQSRYNEIDEMNEKLATYAVIADDEQGQISNPPVVDWEALRAVNPDVVAWIQIPGTVINYPVYQADDNDYYLNRDAEGNYGIGGQIFLDYQNSAPGMIDRQTIIYGHHMKNGAMFKQVADMDNQQYFDSINTVWYVTEQDNFELMPLFVYHTDPNDTNVRIFSFSDAETFHSYLSDLMAAKGVAVHPEAERIISGTDHILTLSTCNYIEGSGRTMLVCVEKAEAERALNAA